MARFAKISYIVIVLRHKMLAFPFLMLEQHITFTFCQSHDRLTFK